LPEEPKIPIYYSEDDLKAISEDDFKKLAETEQSKYEVKEGFAGCLKNCKLFSSCLGRLATDQTSKSPMLKSIFHTQSTMGKMSVETAKAQYLAWQPSTEGLIYPRLNKEVHMLTAGQMANMIDGAEYDNRFTKQQLIEMMISMGAQFYSGLDWGFTHKFSVTTAALIGHILYIIDVISISGLEVNEKVELCKQKIQYLKPIIYPDNAYPSDIETFRRAGFTMIDFQKDVIKGIEAGRSRIAPSGRS
jgi:hypothetical protein